MALEEPISQEKQKILMPFGGPLSEPLAMWFVTVLGKGQKADGISERDSLAAFFQKWHVQCWLDGNRSSCQLTMGTEDGMSCWWDECPDLLLHLPLAVQG